MREIFCVFSDVGSEYCMIVSGGDFWMHLMLALNEGFQSQNEYGFYFIWMVSMVVIWCRTLFGARDIFNILNEIVDGGTKKGSWVNFHVISQQISSSGPFS